MELKVIRERCQGHGICAGIDPDLFVLDDDGYIVMDGTYPVPDGKADNVEAAVRCCPEEALELPL